VFLALGVICLGVLGAALVVWNQRTKNRTELEQHSISPEQLQLLLASRQDVLLFDVRQPLDLLAYSEIIPGAQRIPPKEVLEGTATIPKEKEAVVYCTCPGEKTSREILGRALSLHFTRIRFLKGGLEAWKAKGYAVEPYEQAFHL
jgi:rhodanese-related sulfurtransferase